MRKSIFRKLEAQGLIANYNRLRKNLPPRLPEKVYIWDETLREGAETPTVFLTYVEKVKFAKMMDELGVSIVAIGFPGLSEDEKNNVRRIGNENFHQISLSASARPVKSDIDACLESGIKEVPIFTPFNELNLQYRLKMTKEQVLLKTRESIEYAKEHGLFVDFVLEDGTRTFMEDITKIFSTAIEAGADRVALADSVGFMRPLSMRYLISHIREALSALVKKNVPLGIHCHNDFGLATANALAAVEEGATYIHTCIAGLGQRAGCTPLEEVVAVLELLYNIDTGVDLNKLYRLSQLAEKTFALPIQFHKPIIGENAFSQEIAEETEDTRSQPLLYVPFPPEIIGRETQFYLGRRAGKKLIESRIAEAGIKASPMQVEEIMRRMKRMHESTDKGEVQMTFYQIKRLMRDLRKGITEESFWKVVEEVTRQKPKLPEKPVTTAAIPSVT